MGILTPCSLSPNSADSVYLGDLLIIIGRKIRMVSGFPLLPRLPNSFNDKKVIFIYVKIRLFFRSRRYEGHTSEDEAVVLYVQSRLLFNPPDSHIVVVIVTGEQKRPFMELCGLVGSRLRILVSSVER